MHFDDITWLDFVRGLLTADETWLMQQHLTVGCVECARAHAFWSKMTDVIAREADYGPDASDMRVVTDAFKNANRTAAIPNSTELALLIFDSFREAAPAGFRSALMQARHVVFRAGQWTISLRMKTESANQVFLTGHVMKIDSATEETGAMEVILQQSESPVAGAVTNDFGEFHLEYRNASYVRLFVKVSPAETLEIHLPDQNLLSEEIRFEE